MDLVPHVHREGRLTVVVELSEIAAGLPMAASFALVSGITGLREGRRRAVLNEALHELRRPLQVLALSLPGETASGETCESSLRLATAALERLDREINGEPPQRTPRPVEVRALLEAAAGRWRNSAVLRGGGLKLCWRAAEPIVVGGESELSQMVDNLISNAIEHGGGRVAIEVRESGERLRIAVIDAGGGPSRDRRGDLRERLGGRCRHGHGLRVVARTAREHGGNFQLRCRGRGTEARVELPLCVREGER